MKTDIDQRITLAVPGGLAGQIFAVGYGAWISSQLGKSVHLQFHDVGTSIAKFSVAELCETPTAKHLDITFSQIRGGWPPVSSLSTLSGLRGNVSTKLSNSFISSFTRGAIRRAQNEFQKHVDGGNDNTLRFNFGVITKAKLQSAKLGSTIVGYPVEYQIVEDSWPLLAQMVRESGLPDFASQTERDESIAIHWRLGDYVGNPTHGAVNWSSLVHCLQAISPSKLPLKIFTDSPELAKNIIGRSLPGREYSVISGEIWSDLSQMTRSQTFIGTNSGVSFLAALAMSQGRETRRVWLPKQWFLDQDAERQFSPPARTYERSFFYPVGLVTHGVPN